MMKISEIQKNLINGVIKLRNEGQIVSDNVSINKNNNYYCVVYRNAPQHKIFVDIHTAIEIMEDELKTSRFNGNGL